MDKVVRVRIYLNNALRARSCKVHKVVQGRHSPCEPLPEGARGPSPKGEGLGAPHPWSQSALSCLRLS